MIWPHIIEPQDPPPQIVDHCFLGIQSNGDGINQGVQTAYPADGTDPDKKILKIDHSPTAVGQIQLLKYGVNNSMHGDPFPSFGLEMPLAEGYKQNGTPRIIIKASKDGSGFNSSIAHNWSWNLGNNGYCLQTAIRMIDESYRLCTGIWQCTRAILPFGFADTINQAAADEVEVEAGAAITYLINYINSLNPTGVYCVAILPRSTIAWTTNGTPYERPVAVYNAMEAGKQAIVESIPNAIYYTASESYPLYDHAHMTAASMDDLGIILANI